MTRIVLTVSAGTKEARYDRGTSLQRGRADGVEQRVDEGFPLRRLLGRETPEPFGEPIVRRVTAMGAHLERPHVGKRAIAVAARSAGPVLLNFGKAQSIERRGQPYPDRIQASRTEWRRQGAKRATA